MVISLNNVLINAVLILQLLSSFPASAQNELGASYYLDLNKSSVANVHEITESSLNIQYIDKYGEKNGFLFSINNWKGEQIAVFNLNKNFGVNYYKINIEASYKKWKEGEVYTCSAVDEAGHRYVLLVTKSSPDSRKPKVDILVTPVGLHCNQNITGGNLVEFYAEISGGNIPYTIHWYVLNNEKTDFLYQPREQTIVDPEQTMMITVDKDPDYFVLLHVIDACGNEEKKMVNIVCQAANKQINTLFIEPIRNFPNRNFGN